MKQPFTFLFFALFLCLFFSSCVTYHLSTQSLLEQLAETKKEKKVNIIVTFPVFFPGTVYGNSLKEIKVLDENYVEHILPVNNHTGVKITKRDSSHTLFYFDTLLVQDSIINGCKSHFMGGLSIHPIKLKDIAKIELQK